MNKMYKPDPTQLRTENLNTYNKSDNKVVELENKLKRLTEQFSKIQSEVDRLTRTVKRQGSEVNTVIGRINQSR